MTWFLIVVLTLVVLLALLAVIIMATFLGDDSETERARIETEVRRAERRLHDVARHSLEAMLDEARKHSGTVK